MTTSKDDGPKVAEVPGQDGRLAMSARSHDDEVWEIHPAVRVTLGEIDSGGQLVVGGGHELVHAGMQRCGKGSRRGPVTSGV